ncbi:MAG: DNA repair ATPase [Acidobacteriota bacterium]
MSTDAPRQDDIERGTYEILRDRLRGHAQTLFERAEALNQQRLEIFGGTELAVIGNERIRTENNCVPRDIEQVGGALLFGYQVFLGLRSETKVDDVLSLHRVDRDGERLKFELVSAENADNPLANADFQRDFRELFKYYKETRLLQLRRVGPKLLAIFQTGAGIGDVKVFRWALAPDGTATYVDNRGERDHIYPPQFDFEWTNTSRADFVLGRHPHVNVLDTVFVETVGGDLTVKVEDNTEDGEGIYRELVDEADQSLDDANIAYAELGNLILLRVLPYNETTHRYLVFNRRTKTVTRIDNIGLSCQQLPEDHGIIFPGGYYLASGETKSFDTDTTDMEFKRVVRSPNGEDVLYVFHARRAGRSILLPYNMIRKAVQNPIQCHGFSIFADGTMVVSRASEEATRVHPMQIWQTPFVSDEHAARAPQGSSFLEKVGNADLVRGVSDALTLHRMVSDQTPSQAIYEDLIAAAGRMNDAYYWLGEDAIGDLATPLDGLREVADQIVGEFAKVQELRGTTRAALDEAETELRRTLADISPEFWDRVEPYVEALATLRRQRGHLIGLHELRYADHERIRGLEAELEEAFDRLSQDTVRFLLGEDALTPYRARIEERIEDAEAVETVRDLQPIREALDETAQGLELLTEVVGNLSIDDATVRTQILESIAEVLSVLNRARAVAEARRKELRSREGKAEFGAEIGLFGQSVAGAMAVADDPEACDDQLAKLMLQLEELESRFSDLDDSYLEQLTTKREEVYEAFASRKQALLDARQRRADRLMKAAGRILEGLGRRAATFADNDELNAFFAGDAMVHKLRATVDELRELGDSVRADELDSRLASAQKDAARAMRDRRDIFEEGGEVIKLGRHRFSVNTRPLELTLVPRGEGDDLAMTYHLTGTDFYETVDDDDFQETRPFWDQFVVSESPAVYRGEYLAYSVLRAAEERRDGVSRDMLAQASVDEDGFLPVVRRYAAERYDEGYERGLHDHDAAAILAKLFTLYQTAGSLRFAPRPRAAAVLFWAFYQEPVDRVVWQRRAESLGRLRETFAHSGEIAAFAAELSEAIIAFFAAHELPLDEADADLAGRYLFEELSRSPVRFVSASEAETLRDRFRRHLERKDAWRGFEEDLRELENQLTERWRLAQAWLDAYLEQSEDDDIQALAPARDGAIELLLTAGVNQLEREVSAALGSAQVTGLLGQHGRVQERAMQLRLDEFLARLSTFGQRRVPAYRDFQQRRHQLLVDERDRLRLSEFEPRVMSAFVRNRLINEVYLPLIGDNLAKQLGALGDGKRTDQMGLLLLISPPGYGKTTLMEYVANRLGLIFVKVNGPALGHSVHSLDPTEAPNLTARQEVNKINFALEMGNNVLLYLDDIQHTHPELLQKFISLCDAQRRIEGVWNDRTRTYDLRGKRFAVCMAGNPYTESGETFRIPDMLANRADTYNLGDILEGKDDVFALSYLENSLTSNATLAPLATRGAEDLFLLVRMASGEEIPADRLAHDYSRVELDEMLAVLRKLTRVQEVLLAVNQSYIASAAQDDAYRTEPPFQLQGSYRNMNKLAEKIVPVMNDEELEALIDDHYLGEAQTLTTGAEQNLLKLKELRGVLAGEDRERWEAIKQGYVRQRAMGGSEDDPTVRVVSTLGLLGDRLHDIGRAVTRATASESGGDNADAALATRLHDALGGLREGLGDELGESLGQHLGQHLGSTLTPVLERLSAAADTDDAGQEASDTTAQLVASIERSALDLGQRFEQVLERLAEAAVAPAEPTPTEPVSTEPNIVMPPPLPPPLPVDSKPSVDLTPYLDRLAQTMQAVADAPRGTEVVQTLGPGVRNLLGRLGENVGDTLLPLVRELGRRMKATGLDDRALVDLLDRSLRQLDELHELVDALEKIDTSALRDASSSQ